MSDIHFDRFPVPEGAMSPRKAKIERARQQADDVSAMIEAGKRIPRAMTEDLRNRVRELIRLLEEEEPK